MKKIRHPYPFVMLLLVLLLSVGIGCAALIQSDDRIRLTPQPQYTVRNRWEDEAGKTLELQELTCTHSRTLHNTFSETPPGSMLVIPAEHLGITAYTNGKILYQCEAAVGRLYHLIPLEDVGDGGTVYLHLTPCPRLTGSICGTVRQSTVNDWLLTLPAENRCVLPVLAGLLVLTTAVFTAVLCRRDKRRYRLLYLPASAGLLTICLTAGSGMLQCLVGNALLLHAIRYGAYLLIPVPLLSYAAVRQRQPSRGLYGLQAILIAYTGLRLVLLFGFSVPMDRGIWLAHCLTAATAIAVTDAVLRSLKEKAPVPAKPS